MTPRDVQELIQETVETPMRETPQVTLEELDGDDAPRRRARSRRSFKSSRATLTLPSGSSVLFACLGGTAAR